MCLFFWRFLASNVLYWRSWKKFKQKARKNYLTRAVVYLTRKKKTFQSAFMRNLKQKASLGQFSIKKLMQEGASCLNNQTLSDFLNLGLTFFLRCSYILAKSQPECSYKRGSNKKKRVHSKFFFFFWRENWHSHSQFKLEWL